MVKINFTDKFEAKSKASGFAKLPWGSSRDADSGALL